METAAAAGATAGADHVGARGADTVAADHHPLAARAVAVDDATRPYVSPSERATPPSGIRRNLLIAILVAFVLATGVVLGALVSDPGPELDAPPVRRAPALAPR